MSFACKQLPVKKYNSHQTKQTWQMTVIGLSCMTSGFSHYTVSVLVEDTWQDVIHNMLNVYSYSQTSMLLGQNLNQIVNTKHHTTHTHLERCLFKTSLKLGHLLNQRQTGPDYPLVSGQVWTHFYIFGCKICLSFSLLYATNTGFEKEKWSNLKSESLY